MILHDTRAVDLVMVIAVALVLVSVAYLLMLMVLSRRDPARRRPAEEFDLSVDPGYEVVFVIPCLNEERVLGASLTRILALDHPRIKVLVVDDGSDDGTADVVRAVSDPRLHLLQRVAPEARQGKGQALNAAVRHIRSGAVTSADPAEVIVVVVDADGRLEPHTLHAVLPSFADPAMGGVQIGVRINNRKASLLARMQDIEFVLYTEVFQRGRRHLGSVGLGGNGQFVRLSALQSLGSAPWTDSLAEDLDLGVRLLIHGWSIDFCRTAAVHQQGLVDLGRWVRQRTRWFQGHLQSWGLLPDVLARLRGRARADLSYHLTSPILLLVGSLLSLAFVTWILGIGLSLIAGRLDVSWMWLSAYAFAAGPAVIFGSIYWRLERGTGLSWLKVALLMHLYVGYATFWYLAGWRAVWRTARGQTGWVKTDRLVEQPDPAARPALATASPDR